MATSLRFESGRIAPWFSTSVRPEPAGANGQRTLLSGPAIGTGCAALASLATAFSPWMLSGATRRSGFALAAALDEAGLVRSLPAHLLLVSVWVLPALVGLALGALVLRRRALAAGLSGLAGLVVLVASLVALTTLGPGVEIGPFLGLGVSTATLAWALFEIHALVAQKGRVHE